MSRVYLMCERVQLLGLPAIAACLVLACQAPPGGLRNQCVADWPASQPFVPAEPVAGVTPEILWRSRITGSPANDWLVASGDYLAFTAATRLYILDRTGQVVARRDSAGFERVSAAVADDAGNFYFAGISAHAVAPDGSLRWVAPLTSFSDRVPLALGRAILDPFGGLFFAASDGYLYGIDSRDGSLLWQRQVSDPAKHERAPMVIGGVGNAVLAASPDGTWRPGLWNRTTGEPMAWFTSSHGERHGALIGPEIGIIVQRMEDRGGSYPWMHIAALDACSNQRFEIPARRPQWPVLLGPGDRLYVVERDDRPGSPTSVSVYDPDGSLAAGPADMPIPWGIGADGTIYALACDSPGMDGPSRLYAYGPDLTERWMLPLGDACPTAGPVIDSTGRLYFTWYFDRATEVVAVQTRSPGLAATAWPTRRRDPHGTGWLR